MDTGSRGQIIGIHGRLATCRDRNLFVQEREINRLRETTRLEKEEQERRWNRKQKENELETDQLKERARLEYTEMEKLRKDNEQLKRLREEE